MHATTPSALNDPTPKGVVGSCPIGYQVNETNCKGKSARISILMYMLTDFAN